MRELDTDQVTVRIDQTLSNSTRIFGRYSFHDQRQSDPNAYPALGNAPLSTRGQNVVLSMSNTLKSSLLHDVRFSYVPSVVDLEAFLQGQNPYDALGIRGFEETERPGVGGSFPDFAWSGYTAMNGSAFDQRPKTQDLKVYEVSDNLTWVKGRHIVKFGGKFRRWEPLFTDSKQYAGQWNFDGSLTQNAGAHGRHRRRLRRLPPRLSALRSPAPSRPTSSAARPTTGTATCRTTSRSPTA